VAVRDGDVFVSVPGGDLEVVNELLKDSIDPGCDYGVRAMTKDSYAAHCMAESWKLLQGVLRDVECSEVDIRRNGDDEDRNPYTGKVDLVVSAPSAVGEKLRAFQLRASKLFGVEFSLPLAA
jgi:hypothetical protein